MRFGVSFASVGCILNVMRTAVFIDNAVRQGQICLVTGVKMFGETKPPVVRALAVSIQEVCHEEA